METSSAANLVRRAYDEWNWYGSDALRKFLSDDVRLEDSPDLPDAASWQGADAVIGRLDAVAEAVGGGWVEIRGVVPAAEEYLVHMVWRLDDAGEGVPLGDVFHLVRVKDGKLASIRVFRTREEADRAAEG